MHKKCAQYACTHACLLCVCAAHPQSHELHMYIHIIATLVLQCLLLSQSWYDLQKNGRISAELVLEVQKKICIPALRVHVLCMPLYHLHGA